MIRAPAGRLRLSATGVVNDTGEPDPIAVAPCQSAVEDLPGETLVFLLGSRYCETDRLATVAWDLFGKGATGAQRIQAGSRKNAVPALRYVPCFECGRVPEGRDFRQTTLLTDSVT